MCAHRREQAQHRVPVAAAEEPDAIGNPEPHCVGLEPRALGPVTQPQELDTRNRSDRGPEAAEILLGDEPSRKGEQDPTFAALYFNFGRYLLISCSSPGSLPSNLQGVWADGLNPPWSADYHININIQMNYWPAETTGLSECAMPLMDYIVDQAPACREAIKRAFGAKTRGWTARTSQSIFGGKLSAKQAADKAWTRIEEIFEKYPIQQA